MSRRTKLWRVIAALFALLNVGGAAVAIAGGEPLHAALHVVLLIATYVAWRVATRRRRPAVQQVEERLDRLQRSLDAMAVDVERIGEAQRFMTKLGAERARKAE